MSINFSTCDFCDAHKADTDGVFRVLPPVFHHYGAVKKFFGCVVTVKCYEDNSQVKAILDTPGEGRILVVDGASSLRRALLGGMIGGAAVKNNWAGVVLDGCVRDVAELSALPVGICALAAIPLPTERQNQGQCAVPVHLQGVRVVPGDWLYADEDGIVINSSKLHSQS